LIKINLKLISSFNENVLLALVGENDRRRHAFGEGIELGDVVVVGIALDLGN